MKQLSVFKTNQGIFHLGQRKHASTPSIIASIILAIMLFTYMIIKSLAINDILGANVYIENINIMKTINIQKEADKFNYNNDTEGHMTSIGLDKIEDNVGLFPTQFFVHNIECKDMDVTV